MTEGPPTALLTGAGGMLAADLAAALQGAGFVLAPRTHAELDITDAAAVAREVDRIAPAVVVNAAGFTDVDGAEAQPRQARRANADGPAALARACRDRGARLVHFGTDYVFDGDPGRPWREDDPPAPPNEYGRTKRAGEDALRDILPDGHLIVRSEWLYGPRGRCFPRTVLGKLARGEDLAVVDDQVGSPTWTMDLAEATAALLGAGATGTVHFTARGACSWHGFALALVDEAVTRAGIPAPAVRRISSAALGAPARRPPRSALDTSRYTALTGRQPPRWRRSLTRFLDGPGAALIDALVKA